MKQLVLVLLVSAAGFLVLSQTAHSESPNICFSP